MARKRVESPLDHIKGLDRIIKVLCPKCRIKAEKEADQWMAEEFKKDKEFYDGRKKKARFRLVRKRPL
jgi:hypothetical protein